MVAAAGKRESVSLSLVLEVNNLGLGTLFWAEGVEEADLRHADMETGESTCRRCHV